MDNISKVKTNKLINFENQTKNTHALWSMPATWESMNVICAFIRWHEFGHKSWNYKDADFDAYLVTSWTAKMKEQIIRSVREISAPKTPYIDAAITSEIYRQILCGQFREHSLKNFNAELLLKPRTAKSGTPSHCKEWNSLVSLLSQRHADQTNQSTIRQYFNISQGGGSSVIVLDELKLTQTLQRVKRSKLSLPMDDLEIKDEIRQRNDVYDYAKSILTRIEQVADAESQKAKSELDKILRNFEDEEIDEDDIEILVETAKNFYTEINNSQINIVIASTDAVKRNAKQIAKAVHDISEALDAENPLDVLMCFSSDPLSDIKPLIALLDQLTKDIEKSDVQISNRLNTLNEDAQTEDSCSKYGTLLNCLEACESILEGGPAANDY